MLCPFCSANDDRVIDSRSAEAGAVIRRRRLCNKCGKRFTTYERVEASSRLMVVKRDGRSEPFTIEKILVGVVAACGKRPVPDATRRRIASEVEEEIHRTYDREVPSRDIGLRVMAKLRDLDEVAYIRYASEYHRFQDVGEIAQEIEQLAARIKETPDQPRLFGDGDS